MILEIRLTGHLTAPDLEAAFARLAPRLRAATTTYGLVVDCAEMTGYDAEARERFVEWNRAHHAQIARIAIVTQNRLWHMVISAMSLATSQPMRPFDDRDAARAWLAAA